MDDFSRQTKMMLKYREYLSVMYGCYVSEDTAAYQWCKYCARLYRQLHH